MQPAVRGDQPEIREKQAGGRGLEPPAPVILYHLMILSVKTGLLVLTRGWKLLSEANPPTPARNPSREMT